MSAYIEERPDAIEAIKKAIDEKWNPICMGSVRKVRCALCDMFPCMECPLTQAYPKADNCCPQYNDWDNAFSGENHAEAEAMLEALVMLLPLEHRKEYGG